MQDILLKINQTLQSNPGKCLYCWTGVADERHPLIRLDRVYLNIIYCGQDGIQRFRRILGYRKNAGSNEEVVSFTPELVRIQNGVRRGRLLPAEELTKDERWKPAGVSKVLSTGKYPWTFDDKRSGDRQILELLQELSVLHTVPTTSGIVYPVFYLVAPARSREVQLRDSQEALLRLQKTRGYDPLLAPSENLAAIADELARPLSDGKLAWPFKWFCRAGVVTADPDTMPSWAATTALGVFKELGI
jgi:hypothetical protein